MKQDVQVFRVHIFAEYRSWKGQGTRGYSAEDNSRRQTMNTNAGCICCDSGYALSERQSEKFRQWLECLHNIVSGDVRIGSRTPLRDKPIFLTPEVLPGGFANGRLMAGGDLAPFEQELVNKNGWNFSNLSNEYRVQLQNLRKSLNKYFLSPKGLGELFDLLKSGKYHCVYPEEAALLAVLWMLERRDFELARGLVSTIAPYFGDVRFYPHPSSAPKSLDLKCSLLTVGAFKRGVSDMRVSHGSLSYAINKLIVEDCAPSYDRLVSLILATCKKGAFDLIPFEARPSNKMVAAFKILFRRFENVQRMYESFLHLAKRPKKELRQLGESRNCGKLLRFSKAFVERKTKRITRIERSEAQRIIIQIRDRSRRGLPSVWTPGQDFSNAETRLDELPRKLKIFRERQRKTTLAEHQLVSHDWKELSLNRVTKPSVDDQTGIDDVGPMTQPVTRREAERHGFTRGTAIPPLICRMVRMLERQPLKAMFERELVPSMEVLAILVDQILGAAQAQTQGPIETRRLYASLLGAFRNRRSLLLFDYESQVKFEELPWVHRLEEVRREHDDADDRDKSQLLCEMVKLCISKWPDVMIPNKMITALDHMARGFSISTADGPWIGLLPELAADIFMGGFTPKWCLHAALARKLLASSLYAKYYGTELRKSLWDGMDQIQVDARHKCRQFTSLCTKRGEKQKMQGYVARNRAVIEESMILTGQNYPYLLEVLDYHGKGFDSKELLEICVKCFQNLKQTMIPALADKTPWQTRTRITKNVAYGWRQLVILVSSMDTKDVEHFFRQTISLEEAVGGCTLQRALVDLRAVWMAMQNEAWTGRPWKPLRGWHSGQHSLWDKLWCERLRNRAGSRHDSHVRSGDLTLLRV